MIPGRFFIRELLHGKAQSLTFILCVALSIATLTAVNSFRTDVRQVLLNDAQALHGGDVIVHSHYPLSEPLLGAIEALESSGEARLARIYSFYTVASSVTGTGSLLADIRAVGQEYPLYGTVDLASGQPFEQAVRPGAVVVAPDILERLNVKAGDRIRLGNLELTVAGVVSYDPTRPVSAFSLGPRIFISADDARKTGLLGMGSRSSYELLLKLVDPGRAAAIAEQLTAVAAPGQERIDTAGTARSPVKRFYDNLLFYLSCISIFTLLLSGLGMQSALAALLRQKLVTIAIAKTVGASRRFLLTRYLALVLTLGGVGSVVGVGAGVVVKRLFPQLLGELVPPGIEIGIAFWDIATGVLIGLLVVVVFSALPLYRIDGIRPVALLRHESAERSSRTSNVFLTVLMSIFLGWLVARQLNDVKTGLTFLAGCTVFIFLIYVVATLILLAARRCPIANLTFRVAQKSLFRPGNATRSIMVTLVSALAVLLAIFLVRDNLVNSFISSFPEDAPNLFCIDIQPDQQKDFLEMVGNRGALYPVVRGRLVSINGTAIDFRKEQQRRSDSLAREFNLTYRSTLLDDEVIVHGTSLFGAVRRAHGSAAVSVLDTVADIGDIRVGDALVFSIQGLPVTTEVTSIRSRIRSKLHPFFYFVFPDSVLARAPHTLFAALHLTPKQIAPLVSRIVKQFPNISTINVADAAVRIGSVIARLAGIISFFAVFAIAAGVLILIGSVLATRLERMRDGAYYKVVGANTRFVLLVTLWENLFIGLVSSVLAAVLGIFIAWYVCHWYLDLVFSLSWLVILGMIPATCLLVSVVGVLSGLPVIRQKPAVFLARNNGV